MVDNLLSIKGLSKSFGSGRILNSIDLDVGKGDVIAIIGPSGAGKTTLLRCISFLERADAGYMAFADKEYSLHDAPRKDILDFRRKTGFVFQNYNLFLNRTAIGNITEGLITARKMPKAEAEAKGMELLRKVGLEDKAGSYPSELSGGQQQRIAIARAMASDPLMIFFDEPTSALDPNTTKTILELISKINKELGISVVLVTHEMEVVKEIAQKAVLLEHGKIIGSGEISSLFLRPNKKMKEFLGESDFLPSDGINIKLYFPKEVAQKTLITSMARELDIDFNIVWGRIEKLNQIALGNIVINIKEENKEAILSYIQKSGVLWELVDES